MRPCLKKIFKKKENFLFFTLKISWFMSSLVSYVNINSESKQKNHCEWPMARRCRDSWSSYWNSALPLECIIQEQRGQKDPLLPSASQGRILLSLPIMYSDREPGNEWGLKKGQAFGDKSRLTGMLADPCILPWTSENKRPNRGLFPTPDCWGPP